MCCYTGLAVKVQNHCTTNEGAAVPVKNQLVRTGESRYKIRELYNATTTVVAAGMYGYAASRRSPVNRTNQLLRYGNRVV